MTEKHNGTRYAVVDLEATGTGSEAKIIQVGIVIVQDGRVMDTYETDINPHETLSPYIRQLTGISNRRLKKAPDFGQVAEEIYRLIEDAVFVAHNVKFDGNLLAEALFFEGYDLWTPRVDTVELAQLFFPTVEKYSLSHLAEELNLELEQAHTAIADAWATAHLLLKIQEKIAQLPKTTIGQILELSDNLIHETRMVIEEVYENMSDYTGKDYVSVHGLMIKKESDETISRRLDKDFSKNIQKLGLERRTTQEEFAKLVEERLLDQEDQVHFLQAQAGLGKTYGYLLPLLAHTEQPLVVSVPTHLLQQQIMEKEGKQLAEGFQISVQSIKSARHFLKLEHFWQTLQREDSNRLLNRHKMQLLVWLCETETGDLDEFKQRQRYQPYFDELQHDGNVAAQSVFAEWDFWRRLQSKAQRSRVLLTNHSYLLHHLKDQAYLFEHRILVVDEAQKLLLTAEGLASQRLLVSPLLNSMQSYKDRAFDLLEKRLYESLFFELQQLVLEMQAGNRSDIRREQLQQLTQNLQELGELPAPLADLRWLLEYYDHFWLVKEELDGQKVPVLQASQMELLDVASLLPQTKIFCISATLELGKKIRLSDLLGFSKVTMDCLPSQKSQQQEIILLKDLPSLVDMDLTEQAHYIARFLQELERFGRPILTLFTSYALLSAVSDNLAEWGVEHIAQQKHGEESVVKKRFERGDCRLLLGTGSFWEGVDFSNQPEIIQVIPRLPFENPKDLLVQKINHHLRIEGKQPFYDYNLPVMLLKLKQAIGRTKRTAEQMSAVILLDHRVLRKRYSRRITHFLKNEYHVSVLDWQELEPHIQHFFESETNSEE
ncbi:bifunctional DnaQ family exonuclease/ATP-dependent helicase [Streptococcus ovis]|uniref:bifunctional DnaQ family exonuclease/ATP-dependent helicase n=1 Tax=Streptococcus ovis TaxID=82806 RepID=UPI0003A861D8|nr:bifunctional DnaQ family exonuclease/ATP-dependent helicase [Streptococcus ovis]